MVNRNRGIELLNFTNSLLASDESTPICAFDIYNTSEASVIEKLGVYPCGMNDWLAKELDGSLK